MRHLFESVPCIGRRLSDKVRFVAGFAVAASGAGVLLTDTIHSVSSVL